MPYSSMGSSCDKIPVSSVWRYGCIEHITSKEMAPALPVAAVSIGDGILGIKKEDEYMYLIRSGAAMTKYLGEGHVYTIMTIGR